MKKIIIFIISAIIVWDCDLKQKDYVPENDFIKIYNDSDISKKYYPETFIQTTDGGFIVVSGILSDSTTSQFPETEIFKTNNLGKIVWVKQSKFQAPSGKLFYNHKEIGFVGMDDTGVAQLIIINEKSGNVSEIINLNITKPLASLHDNEKFLVLGYNNVSRSSVLKMYNTNNFSEMSSVSFDAIDEDFGNKITYHLNKTGNQYPFFVGKWGDNNETHYLVNCFYNFGLYILFLDNNINPTGGNIFSFQEDAYVNSINYLSDSSFAISRYYKGDNYIIPSVNVDMSISQHFNDETKYSMPEIESSEQIKTCEINKENSKLIVYTAATNSNSIKLYKYNNTKDIIDIIGEYDLNERTEVKDIISTSDNGLAILARTYILGKYPSPVIIKVPPEKFR